MIWGTPAASAAIDVPKPPWHTPARADCSASRCGHQRSRGLHVIARPKGRGVVALGSVVDLHGPSTDRLIVRASWNEQVDDVTADGPVTVHKEDVVVNSAVAETERAGALYLVDFLPFGAGPASAVDLSEGSIGLHAAIQKFPDTHYRQVTYVPSGTTRYRELFAAADVPCRRRPVAGRRAGHARHPQQLAPGGADSAGHRAAAEGEGRGRARAAVRPAAGAALRGADLAGPTLVLLRRRRAPGRADVRPVRT